jgi:CelD/BcsL family acetyltransferase involved in cellulose biosynthesis
MQSKFRLIKSNKEFRRLEPIWNDLLSQSPANNYFLTWEWLWNWWEVFAETNDELRILVFENGDAIIGIAPFYVRKRFLAKIYPVRRMMFLGTQEHGEGDVGSDYMNVICREGDEISVVHALFMAIAEHDICDEIYLSKMDTASNTFDLFQQDARSAGFLALIADEFVSPYIELPATWDDYLAALNSSMRYKIRNERRKLQKSGNIVTTRVKNADDLERGFKELSRLHKNRWEEKGAEGAFSNPQFNQFHKRIMLSMLKNGRLELVMLSENGSTKAVLYNIAYNGKIYFYQSGINTDDGKAAYGYVLHSHCIEEAIKRGLREYDFLPKGKSDDYKDRFAKDCRMVSDLYIARAWAAKQFTKARESARSIYHTVKPLVLRVS